SGQSGAGSSVQLLLHSIVPWDSGHSAAVRFPWSTGRNRDERVAPVDELFGIYPVPMAQSEGCLERGIYLFMAGGVFMPERPILHQRQATRGSASSVLRVVVCTGFFAGNNKSYFSSGHGSGQNRAAEGSEAV